MLVTTLSQTLEDDSVQRATRLVVACSGGLDSMVLLHALVNLPATPPIHAVHINHGLQADAKRFSTLVADACESMSVPLEIRSVAVDSSAGRDGPEAAARRARYAAFEELLCDGDVLLSAHHEDDQAETLLLNLLRASGPRGLAGVPRCRRLGHGTLIRPLLTVPRASLVDYAKSHGLQWLEDSTNSDTRFSRNFLRHEVLPLLETQFPSVTQRLSRSASLQNEAQSILDEVAVWDLEAVGGDASCFAISALLSLSGPRQRSLLRFCLRTLGLGEPGYARLQQVIDELLPAKDDACPLVQWASGEVRRYRGHIYLMRPLKPPITPSSQLATGAPVRLDNLGELVLQRSGERGLSPEACAAGIEIRFRVGGERLRPLDDAHQRSLKSLMQLRGIVPWMRNRLPLLYIGDRLAAVGDLWIDAEFCVSNGLRPVWVSRPRLF